MDNKINLFKKLRAKRLLLLEELHFLLWCRDVKLWPQSVELKTSVKTRRAKRAVRRANLGLLRAIIKEKRSLISNLEFELYLLHLELAKGMHPLSWGKVDTTSFVNASRQLAKKKKNLIIKRWNLVHKNNAIPTKEGGPVKVTRKATARVEAFGYTADTLKNLNKGLSSIERTTKNNLMRLGIFKEERGFPNQDTGAANRIAPPLGKALVNLTNFQLNDQQISLLGKGPKFALGPKKQDGTMMAAYVEKALEDLPEAEKTCVISNIITVCRNSKMKTSDQWNTMRTLKEMDVVILKADKGETVVLMDKEEFKGKVLNELSSGTYKSLKKDPTNVTCTRLAKMVGNFQNQELINCKVPDPRAPRLFCQVKLHKAGRPLRLIVSAKSSPLCRLEKLVAGLLGKYTKLCSSSIKNSEQLVQLLKRTKPPDGQEQLLSLDIVKLFPSLPRDETLDAINQVLLNDVDVGARLRDEIIQSVSFVFDNSYFCFDNCFYQQIKGSPIGSALSPVIAEIYLINHETRAKLLVENWPRLFVRYVDDHLMVAKKDCVPRMVQQLNSINPDVQFTVEMADQGKIAFLDVAISSNQRDFQTCVFRKPTSSGILMNKDSVHHPAHKMCTWKTLVHRACVVCSSEKTFQDEILYLKELAMLNGFSSRIVDIAVRHEERKNRRSMATSLIPWKKEEKKKMAVLPYLGKISEHIGDIIQKATKKKVTFLPLNKIGVNLFNSKDPLKPTAKAGVYKVPCKCGAIYVGKTTRNFTKRLVEHKAALRNFQPNASAIARHFWQKGCDKGLDWESSRVVINNNFPPILNIREALEISLEQTRYPHMLMNDQEQQLGKYDIWKLLEGRWLFPTGPKYAPCFTTVEVSAATPSTCCKKSPINREERGENVNISAGEFSAPLKVGRAKEGDNSNPPTETRRRMTRSRPRKDVSTVANK